MNKSSMFRLSLAAIGLAMTVSASAQSVAFSGLHVDGGLMKEMSNQRYQLISIKDPVAQARLSSVTIHDSGAQNGGLMKEMNPSKSAGIDNPAAQAHLNQVVLSDIAD